MTSYWLEHALLPTGVADGVLVTVGAGRFTDVTLDAPPGDATRLAGLTIPGLANAHSHAFHRALRGRTQQGRGDFWTWREQMYAVAGRLDPDSYLDLAHAVYAEMAASGITTVGEFHYLHHQPDGTPYDDPNAMGHALIAAAADAGIRICLLDTAYLSSGFGRPVEGVQRRYSDGDIDTWAERLCTIESNHDHVAIGAAYHSIRAVGPDQMRRYASATPLHVHLSEQRAENEECLAVYGSTPVQVLADVGLYVLGPWCTVVHATHLTDADVRLLGETRTTACFCPTTERDLGDGIGPSRALHDAGARLTLGSDSHAVIDLFEEMRAVELDERLATQRRGHWPALELLTAATADGHDSLGFADAGRIEVGARADLVTLDLHSPRTAGCGPTPETAVFAASAVDVTSVVRDGTRLDLDRERVGALLTEAIDRVRADR